MGPKQWRLRVEIRPHLGIGIPSANERLAWDGLPRHGAPFIHFEPSGETMSFIRFTSLRTLASTLTLASALALLGGCGGGGGSKVDPSAFNQDGQPTDFVPPPPAGSHPDTGSGGSGGGSTGGNNGGGDTGGGDNGGGDTGGGSSGGNTGGGAPTVPPPPAPMTTYGPVTDAHGMANSDDGRLWYVENNGSRILSKAREDADFTEVGLFTDPRPVRAMARHAGSGMLYAVVDGGGSDDALMQIDPSSAYAVTEVGPITGYQDVQALCFLTSPGGLYAVDATSDVLLTLDLGTAAPAVVGSLGAAGADIRAMGHDYRDNRLVAADFSTKTFVEIDPTTGTASTIIGHNDEGLDALAYDPIADQYFGVSNAMGTIRQMDPKGTLTPLAGVEGMTPADDLGVVIAIHVLSAQLLEIDPETSWMRVIGYTGIPNLRSVARHPGGAVFSVEPSSGTLYEFAPGTAVGNALGSINTSQASWTSVEGLTFVGTTLYGVDQQTGDIITINTSGPSTSLLGTVSGFPGMRSLGYDAVTGTLSSFDTATQAVIRIDPTNPSIGGSVEAAHPGLAVRGMAWVSDGPKLYGADTAGNQMQLLLDRTPPSLAWGDLHALARHPAGTLASWDDVQGAFVNQLDPDTMQGQTAALMPGSSVQSMAFVDTLGAYVMVDTAAGQLLIADVGFSTVAVIGSLALEIQALAWDANSETLYGVDNLTNTLVSIDTSTAATTPVLVLSASDVQAMTWDSDAGTLRAIDRATGDYLTLDPVGLQEIVSGAGAFTGMDVRGMAFDPQTRELIVVDITTDLISRHSVHDGTLSPGN